MERTDDWAKGIREGYRTKVIRVGNATIEIHRPILTPEEQRRREQQVLDALQHYGKGITNEE